MLDQNKPTKMELIRPHPVTSGAYLNLQDAVWYSHLPICGRNAC